jgi:hypothetical protein
LAATAAEVLPAVLLMPHDAVLNLFTFLLSQLVMVLHVEVGFEAKPHQSDGQKQENGYENIE